MTTIFNIGLEIGKRESHCPEALYNQTVDFLIKQGLTGNKHVNHYGRVIDGYDFSCSVFREGAMDIFYFEGDYTASDIIKNVKRKTRILNEPHEETIQLSEDFLEIIADQDPSILVAPWRNYRASPASKSMSILTPLGWQSTHYHTKDNWYFGVFQLFKPRNENSWYDFDTLKDFAYSNGISSCIFYADGIKTFKGEFKKFKDMSFLERQVVLFQERRRKKFSKFTSKLYKETDNIAKIPKFIKKAKPIITSSFSS